MSQYPPQNNPNPYGANGPNAPYGAPPQGGPPYYNQPPSYYQTPPRDRLQGPAIGMIVAFAMSILFSGLLIFWGIGWMVTTNSVTKMINNTRIPTSTQNPIQARQNRQQAQQAKRAAADMVSTAGNGYAMLFIVWGGVSILLCVVGIVGAVQMMGARSYGMSVVTSIISMVPIGCWFLGLGMGIWGMVVLSDSRVKASFHNPGR